MPFRGIVRNPNVISRPRDRFMEPLAEDGRKRGKGRPARGFAPGAARGAVFGNRPGRETGASGGIQGGIGHVPAKATDVRDFRPALNGNGVACRVPEPAAANAVRAQAPGRGPRNTLTLPGYPAPGDAQSTLLPCKTRRLAAYQSGGASASTRVIRP